MRCKNSFTLKIAAKVARIAEKRKAIWKFVANIYISGPEKSMNPPSMILRLPIFIALLYCLLHGNAVSAQPDTVKIGAYINDIYDIDLSAQSFSAEFWVWFNYSNPALHPQESMELLNAKSFDCPNVFTRSVQEKNMQWCEKKYIATLKKEWDIRNFPFDAQKMTIELEEGVMDTQSLVYLPDYENSKLDSSIQLGNWKIKSFEINSQSRPYQSNFGDPRLSETKSAYTHLDLNIHLQRKAWGLFFSLFTGMYVAFLISWIVFFIEPHYVDPRFGLSVGGLFASVGNKYIVDSELPQTTSFTLVDKLYIITYISLLMCIILSVVSLRLWGSGKKAQSKRFDTIARRVILGLYVLANVLIVWCAASGA